MAEKPIKVDEETDRVVTDLAHFLRSTKKSIVRDAVAEFAEARHALLPPPAGASRPGDRSAGEDGAGIDRLAPMQRLGLRRKELIREFARHRGTNIRVFDASGENDHSEITLLVDTDVIDGGAAAPRLQEIAQHLLATDVTVVSMTALRLMRPERHRRALAESHTL